MQKADYTTLKVGQKVSVWYPGYRGVQAFQGDYTVVKADKTKVVVQHIAEGYERKFSVRRQVEIGTCDIANYAYIVQ